MRFDTDAVSAAGADGACVSACTTSLPLTEALCAVVTTSVVLTCTVYVAAVALAADVTLNVALPVVPGDRLIDAGDTLSLQPAGRAATSANVLAPQ